ncbi:MAG: MFS transporter [Gammaproteobacteria bacterium]|nr:MFS transporter [Gammaproteobacteria bacterium]
MGVRTIEPQRAGFWTDVAGVYAAGLLQGCVFVLLPALGSILQDVPFGLSAARYGALFLPETLGAIASALVAARLEAWVGARRALRLALLCNAAAAWLIAASPAVAGGVLAYALLLGANAGLGFGFGLNLALINHFAAALFPRREIAAVTVLNAVIGAATAASPLILRLFEIAHRWWLWPAVIGVAFLLLQLRPGIDAPARRVPAPRTAAPEPRARLLTLFAAAVLIYGIVEGSFGSWVSVYAGIRHLSAGQGAWALTAFWGTMTAFRLVLGSVSPRWLAPRALYLVAPVAIAICFIATAAVTTVPGLVLAFACAGAACSIYYPFSLSFALQAFPAAQTRTAGVLVAALMVGEGIGSWLPGPAQQWLDLAGIYTLSALWGLPLLWLAWHLTRGERPLRSQAT